MALRIILVLAVVMFSFTRQRLAADQVDVSDLRKLWYAQPAEQWSEALPIGNGRLGAMVYGGIAKEHLQLNEDTLWSGGPHDYANPEALSHLADVRTLLKKGRYADAEALAQEMMGQPIYQAAYQPLGDLFLEFPQHQNVSDYRRELDLKNAVTTVKYRVGDALFTRRVFASFPDQVIVIRLECDQPGQLTFDVSMTSEHPAQSQTMQGDTLELTGQVAPRGVDPKLTGSRALIAPWDQPGMKFAAQVKIKSQGGTVTAADEKVSVEGADAVTLYYSAATNFVNFQDTSGNPSETVARTLDGIQADSFAEIYRRHVEDYDALFSRVSINLGGENSQSLPTDQRVEQGNQGNADLLLIEQVFQYGRYLMIAGSRQGSQPLNLQGIWNKDLNPRWGSKYTININIEMNYWVAEVCNLSECHEPLLRMVGELQAPGVRAAKTHYNSGGWMTHHNTDLWRGTAPVDGAKWGMWPMGGHGFANICGNITCIPTMRSTSNSRILLSKVRSNSIWTRWSRTKTAI